MIKMSTIRKRSRVAKLKREVITRLASRLFVHRPSYIAEVLLADFRSQFLEPDLDKWLKSKIEWLKKDIEALALRGDSNA